MRTFLSIFPLVWPTDEDMARALTDYMPLRLSYGLSVFDMLIAATAVGYGLTLATFNTRHFSAVPDLMLEEPYAR